MRLKFESYEYNRDYGSFSILATEKEIELLENITELFNREQGIAPISIDDTASDFSYNKNLYSEDEIRNMWKTIKKQIWRGLNLK